MESIQTYTLQGRYRFLKLRVAALPEGKASSHHVLPEPGLGLMDTHGDTLSDRGSPDLGIEVRMGIVEGMSSLVDDRGNRVENGRIGIPRRDPHVIGSQGSGEGMGGNGSCAPQIIKAHAPAESHAELMQCLLVILLQQEARLGILSRSHVHQGMGRFLQITEHRIEGGHVHAFLVHVQQRVIALLFR